MKRMRSAMIIFIIWCVIFNLIFIDVDRMVLWIWIIWISTIYWWPITIESKHYYMNIFRTLKWGWNPLRILGKESYWKKKKLKIHYWISICCHSLGRFFPIHIMNTVVGLVIGVPKHLIYLISVNILCRRWGSLQNR